MQVAVLEDLGLRCKVLYYYYFGFSRRSLQFSKLCLKKTLKMKSKQYNIEGVSDINLRTTVVVQISFVGIVFKFYEFACPNSIDRELLLS